MQSIGLHAFRFHGFISAPDDPVAPLEEPRECLGVQPAQVVGLRVHRLVVRLEEHCGEEEEGKV